MVRQSPSTPEASGATSRFRLADLPRNARTLIAISTVNSLALVGVGSLVNPYLRNLGMSAAFVGLYFAVSAVVQGGASFVGGFLADSFGRKRIWLIGKTFQIGAYLLLAAGLRGSAILIVAALSGLSQIGSGAYSALQADSAHARWRATFIAVVQTANSLIGAVAPLAGGMIADRYGARWAFAAVLPLLLLVGGLISGLEDTAAGRRPRVVPAHMPASEVAAAGRRPWHVAVRAKLSDLAEGIVNGPFRRTAVVMLVYSLLNGASNGIIQIALPLLLRDRFAMGYAGIGGIQAAVALGSAMTMIVGARLADRHGRRRMMVGATAIGAMLFWTIPFLASAPQLYLLVFMIGLAANSANGAYGATMMECVAVRSRASFGGMIQGLSALGMALGSLGAGLTYSVQPMLPMIIAAGLYTCGALLMLLFLQETGASAQPRQPAAAGGVAAGQDM